MKKLVYLFGFILAFVALLLGFFTLVEYRPRDIESVELDNPRALDKDELTLLSFNIGYGGLGKDEDFFMDGGSKVMPESVEVVEGYLSGILGTLKENPADFYLIQEVDKNSKRSYGIDQASYLEEGLGLESSFAINFKALYVPFPLPTIGKVHSGLQTLSSYRPSLYYRKSLPVPFKWPVRTVNLKRALLVEEYEIQGREEKFILINTHLEAYDDGQGKLDQSRELLKLAMDYYDQGNYVVVGGDWNQSFPGGEVYPPLSPDLWQAGLLIEEDLPKGWSYLADNSTPSCRSNHKAYQEEDHQVYLIDGFLISPNLEGLSVKTLDYGFSHSDHNPVELKIRLK